MTKFNKDQIAKQRSNLQGLLARATKRNGQVLIYTILRSVSASGMTRLITPFVVDASTGEIHSLAWTYERATSGRMPAEAKLGGQFANKVTGCGMDMGFELAYNIASVAEIGLTGFRHEWV